MKRLYARWKAWRDLDETLAEVERLKKLLELQKHLNIVVTKGAETHNRIARQALDHVAADQAKWSRELAHMNRQNAEDARMISALIAWCKEKKCEPTARDLAKFMQP